MPHFRFRPDAILLLCELCALFSAETRLWIGHSGIANNIDTVPQLEALLLIYGAQDRLWRAERHIHSKAPASVREFARAFELEKDH